MSEDNTEFAIQGAALAMTLGIVALVLWSRNPLDVHLLVAAPKPTQVTMSVVEEPPPPPPPPPPPLQPPPMPEPPPPVPVDPSVPSPLPPPLPPKLRPIVRPRPLPPRPVPHNEPPPREQQPQSEAAPRQVAQAPENHSAEAAYVGVLHAQIERNTKPPDSASYRLEHPSGEVLVSFTLSRSGTVSSVRVLRGSGSSVLDQQAVLIVSGLRYPTMPAAVYPGQASHVFSVPVGFLKTGGDEGL